MHRDVSASTLEMVPLPLASRPQTPASQSILGSQSPTATPQSIGVNLRVTGHCSQGGRKYMEDFFSVAYHQSENAKDLEYAFVGIYDGHGGSEAAIFAKEHLMMEIINQKLFWSDCDDDILRAIREGYIATHYAMWRNQDKWPKTATGLPSTAGTTATVAFIRREKIYIGHVGDSGIVLGYQNSNENFWRSKPLTQDHKPECSIEKSRIVNSGGKVVVKSGVPRVVWNRPRTGHKGPVRRSTPIDEIPFLAVARSLGDLWSYNSALNEFVVSPDPDVKVIKIDPMTFRCLIFGTDGLWNVVSPGEAVDMVCEKETLNERINKFHGDTNNWCNPSKGLVEKALKTWSLKKMRADNTSVVTVILNPPGGKSSESNSFNQFTSSYGQEYLRTNAEILANQNYVQMASLQNNHQKPLPSYFYEAPQPMYGNCKTSHHLSHYETHASSAMRFHLQQQLHQLDGYVPRNMDSDDNSYTANYETNCGTNGYQYYEDQGSNTYTNSFAESYNTLLTSDMEREDSSRSNGSNFISSNSDNSNESINSNPSDYHSYHSLHHTGLAGHDRVQHHYPNSEHKIEQLLYQEQCMSAEEGYSLTKLETRGEQQLRGSSFNENPLNSVQTFQIFGSERSDSSKTEYNQSNSISGSYQNQCYGSDSSNSNFLSSYEDDARCYEPNADCVLLEEIPVTSGTTTSLCIERLDSLNDNDQKIEESKQNSSQKSELEDEIDIVEPNKQNPKESIQIHEISSSVVEEGSSPAESFSLSESPLLFKEENQKVTKEKSRLQTYENTSDSAHHKKPTLPKLVLYPNVPNENYRNMRRSSLQQYPRNFEKRMLRSMTVDYSKRTLRSRNSLSKDMKAKSTANTNARRSTIVQSKFIKAVQSSVHLENSSVISKNSLNLRSRQILTTTAMWGAADSQMSPIPSSSSSSSLTLSSHIQQRKSKSRTFCVSPCSSKNLSTPKTNRSFADSPGTKVREKLKSGNPQFNHNPQQQQIAISFAKRMNLRNSGWGAPKTTIQTRNRAQKRLSR